MKRSHSRRVLWLGMVGVVLWPARAELQPADSFATVQEVSLDRQDGVTAVRIFTSSRVRYEASLLDRPPRLVIDLPETTLAWRRGPLKANRDPVTEVRGSQQRPRVSRIVIELTGKSDYHIESSDSGLRVVFQASGTSSRPAEAPPAPPPPPPTTGSAARPAPAAPEAPPRITLYGIVYSEQGAVAYLQDPTTSHVGRFRVGDSFGEARIEAIEPDHVVFRGPSGRHELWLGDARPAGRPPAPPPGLFAPLPPPPPSRLMPRPQ